jgi:hypothetical protein
MLNEIVQVHLLYDFLNNQNKKSFINIQIFSSTISRSTGDQIIEKRKETIRYLREIANVVRDGKPTEEAFVELLDRHLLVQLNHHHPFDRWLYIVVFSYI